MRSRRGLLIALVVLLLASLPATTSGAPAGSTGMANQVPAVSATCSVPGALEGVDVDSYQGTIDWTQVAQAAKTFGYARVSDGTSTDATFQTNFAGMKGAGLKAGAYLFFEPAQDPTTQANLLVSALNQAHFAAGDLTPAIDVEITGGQTAGTIVANLQTAVNVVQSALGVAPVIYTGQAFWDTTLGGPTSFGQDPLWIVYLGTGCPTLPTSWSNWTLWQYSVSGQVNGIGGLVDLDESNGPTLPIYTPTNQGKYRVYLPAVFDKYGP